jgi:hypothetical protein
MKFASPPPTVEELKAFGAVFSQDEWKTLCSSKEFIETLINEGPKAVAQITSKILSARHKDKARAK